MTSAKAAFSTTSRANQCKGYILTLKWRVVFVHHKFAMPLRFNGTFLDLCFTIQTTASEASSCYFNGTAPPYSSQPSILSKYPRPSLLRIFQSHCPVFSSTYHSPPPRQPCSQNRRVFDKENMFHHKKSNGRELTETDAFIIDERAIKLLQNSSQPRELIGRFSP